MNETGRLIEGRGCLAGKDVGRNLRKADRGLGRTMGGKDRRGSGGGKQETCVFLLTRMSLLGKP